MYLAIFIDYIRHGFELSDVVAFARKPTKTQLVKTLLCQKDTNTRSRQFREISKTFSMDDFYIEKVELINNGR